MLSGCIRHRQNRAFVPLGKDVSQELDDCFEKISQAARQYEANGSYTGTTSFTESASRKTGFEVEEAGSFRITRHKSIEQNDSKSAGEEANLSEPRPPNLVVKIASSPKTSTEEAILTASPVVEQVGGLEQSGEQATSPQIIEMVADRTYLCREGFRFRFGCGSYPQDLEKSLGYFIEAASMGCTDSMAAVAVARIFGIGVEKSNDLANRLLRMGMLTGSTDAIEIRALCCMNGTFGKRCYSSSLQLLDIGVARNSMSCLIWAGFCFEIGLGTRPDPIIAKQAYLAARKSVSMRTLVQHCIPGALTAEDPWTLLKVSLFLLHSIGNTRYHRHALDCLKQAALLGLADAKVYLAICLIQGRWIMRDSEAAVHWLKSANQEETHPVASRILAEVM